VLASLTTMFWNTPSKSWTGGATMADLPLNRRMTVRLGDAVALARIGVVGLDGQAELEALRLCGLPAVARDFAANYTALLAHAQNAQAAALRLHD
jgi:hypothetical protein